MWISSIDDLERLIASGEHSNAGVTSVSTPSKLSRAARCREVSPTSWVHLSLACVCHSALRGF